MWDPTENLKKKIEKMIGLELLENKIKKENKYNKNKKKKEIKRNGLK